MPDSSRSRYLYSKLAIVIFCIALIGLVWLVTVQRVGFEHEQSVAEARGQTSPASFQRERYYYFGAIVASAFTLAFALALMAALSRQKRTREQIAESEGLFKAIFDHAPVGMSHSTLDGRFLKVNQTLSRMLGYTEEELLTRNAREVTFPADIAASNELISQLLGDPVAANSMRLEKRYLRKDGSVLWVLAAFTLVCDSAGKPGYFVTVVQDISADKEAQERLGATFNQDAIGIAQSRLPAITSR